MTVEPTSPGAASPITDRTAQLRQAADTIAAGQQRVRQMADDFQAHRQADAKAAIARAQDLVVQTLRSSKQMMLLGGDMHGMVDMVDMALRQAQPAIKTLRSAFAQDHKATLDLAKAVRDLANASEQIGFMARIAAREPAAANRVRKSASLLDGTLQQIRGTMAGGISA